MLTVITALCTLPFVALAILSFLASRRRTADEQHQASKRWKFASLVFYATALCCFLSPSALFDSVSGKGLPSQCRQSERISTVSDLTESAESRDITLNGSIPVRIEIKKTELLVNGVGLPREIEHTYLLPLMGPPARVAVNDNASNSYYYDDLGIVLRGSSDPAYLTQLVLDFDGFGELLSDAPLSPFNGVLIIDDQVIFRTRSIEELRDALQGWTFDGLPTIPVYFVESECHSLWINYDPTESHIQRIIIWL